MNVKIKTNDYKRKQGFTLLELVIAMAIVGVLVSIAYPAYKQYVVTSRRSDARNSLINAQIALEKCYSRYFKYDSECSDLDNFPRTSSHGFYTIQLSKLTATSYSLTAFPRGSQKEDTHCANIAINHVDAKTAIDSSAAPSAECWIP